MIKPQMTVRPKPTILRGFRTHIIAETTRIYITVPRMPPATKGRITAAFCVFPDPVRSIYRSAFFLQLWILWIFLADYTGQTLLVSILLTLFLQLSFLDFGLFHMPPTPGDHIGNRPHSFRPNERINLTTLQFSCFAVRVSYPASVSFNPRSPNISI